MKKTLHFPQFDATLNTDWANARNNAELTLTLRLGFRRINPAGGKDTGTHHDYGDPAEKARKTIKWTDKSWRAWRINFTRSAERFWHGKFWILNNAGAYPLKSGQLIIIPNIWCKLDIIQGEASTGGHHHVIDVVRLDPSETKFGSHSTLYDSRDTFAVQKRTDSKGNPIMQRAHVHEVGHLLGLGHVDEGKPHCPSTGDTNAPDCYGITDFDMNSVMGAGMRLDVRHAAPWLRAMRDFLKTAPKSPLYTPPPKAVKALRVSKSRLYPRSSAEFEAGAVLTKMPKGR